VFHKIMTPVDLAHKDRLTRALQCAADMAKTYGAEVVYVGVAAAAPSAVAHTPKEYAEKLEAFAAEQAETHGITASAHPATAHDPTIEIDTVLLKAVDALGADLVVMQSHVPNVMDYVWPSHGGRLAEHAACSVLVVRG